MRSSHRGRIVGLTGVAGCAAIVLSAGVALAQTGTPGQPAAPAAKTPPKATPTSASPSRDTNPYRANLRKMMRTLTIDFKDQRLEDVVTFLQEFTDAEFEPAWRGDREDGLDKDQLVSLNVKNLSALDALERVLAKVQTDYEENTWQMTTTGAIQFGPKSVLNREKRVVMYDINDLLTVLPNYTDAPTIDLEQVLQNNQGGGGGGSPFDEEDDNQMQDTRSKQERTQEIVDLLLSLVEPEQWVDNGGNGGTIRAYGGTLIVNAPDYIHRQINGYPYWPSYSASKGDNGRRYVTLTGDTGISKVDGFAEEPVVTPRP